MKNDNGFEALYPNYDGIGTFTMLELKRHISLTTEQEKKFILLEDGKIEFISLRIDKIEGANLIRSL